MPIFEKLFPWLGQRKALRFSDIVSGGIPVGLPTKAEESDFLGRFREIISDPLNLLIERHPLSGCVENGNVILHNGIRVPYIGKQSYYGKFSEILVLNRGVHEPLEEFCFQEVLKVLGEKSVMLELGAYWGHYSMWCQLGCPTAKTYLVEPEAAHLNVARHNFEINELKGEFVQAAVKFGAFEVDEFLTNNNITKLALLHSDIQGFELEMLSGARISLKNKLIDYCFISTHGDQLHRSCLRELLALGYRIEVEADFASKSTSFDGFILASNPTVTPIFGDAIFAGRADLAGMKAADLLKLVESYSVFLKS